jgi:hypothetical protein
MRTLLVMVVLVSLETVGHAQATISIGPQGQYLGNLSGNRIDPDSKPNPFGRSGSRFGADSLNPRFFRREGRYDTLTRISQMATSRGHVGGRIS